MFCPKCRKEIEDNSKFCNNCGNPIESDLKKETTINKKKFTPNIMEVIVIVIICVSLLYFTFSSGGSGSNNPKSSVQTVVQQPPPPDPLQVLSETTPSNLEPEGELYEIYKLGSDYTDVQRENKEREIRGKIVQWLLPVYEVRRKDYGYEITTSGSGYVSTEIHLSPLNNSEREDIESLKTGDYIEVKGKIKGVEEFLGRRIIIDPCIFIPFRISTPE